MKQTGDQEQELERGKVRPVERRWWTREQNEFQIRHCEAWEGFEELEISRKESSDVRARMGQQLEVSEDSSAWEFVFVFLTVWISRVARLSTSGQSAAPDLPVG